MTRTSRSSPTPGVAASAAALAASLVDAERRLRAAGLTGRRAFEALRDTVLARLGRGSEPHPALRDLQLPEAGVDLFGLAYERFFPDLFKGRAGQYFTPRGIAELLVSRLPPLPGKTVLDPTCGSGGLLLLAAREGASVRGIDVDPTMVELARLNLAVARARGSIERADLFAADPEPADVVLANPPFSVPIVDPEVLARFGRSGERAVQSDVLFLDALHRWVRPGGHAALVLPWTVFANGSMQAVRERLDARFRRVAACALPEGVFRPFGGAAGRAALLWLVHEPHGDATMLWAELDDPGYDPSSRRLVATDAAQLRARIAGQGFRPIQGWLPQRSTPVGDPLSAWVSARTDGVRGVSGVPIVDLAHADRHTGELRPVVGDKRGRVGVIEPGQVLFSQMRPELGNVAIVPPGLRAYGSGEWIRLECAHPHFLLHALRSPSWRAQLPPTTGQTRPRTDAATVLATHIPRPSSATLARIEQTSAALFAARRALGEQLAALERAVGRFVDDADEQALVDALDGL